MVFNETQESKKRQAQREKQEELARQKADKERAKRQEQEYARKRKCEHVYVGKKFTYDYQSTFLWTTNHTLTFIVLGFSPKTGEVTARCVDGWCDGLQGGEIQTFSCTQID